MKRFMIGQFDRFDIKKQDRDFREYFFGIEVNQMESYFKALNEVNDNYKVLFEHKSHLISDTELEECYQWIGELVGNNYTKSGWYYDKIIYNETWTNRVESWRKDTRANGFKAYTIRWRSSKVAWR